MINGRLSYTQISTTLTDTTSFTRRLGAPAGESEADASSMRSRHISALRPPNGAYFPNFFWTETVSPPFFAAAQFRISEILNARAVDIGKTGISVAARSWRFGANPPPCPASVTKKAP